jgi:3-deoxy-D-manno-octulosonate 8-phosphate phosphatase (KDO 8-P phosphatase)
LARVELFALDVDGTLTDGRVVYVGEQESQAFCVRDGQGLVWLRSAGVRLAWISGRGCAATLRRAQELGVEFIELRCGDKRAALAAIQQRTGIPRERTLAMGDDLPDLALARAAGFFAAPPEACAEVREDADFITTASAGAGAVREVCELCLRAKGEWRAILQAAEG